MEIAHRYVALQVAVIAAEILGLLYTWCQSLGLNGSAHINHGNVLHLALCLAELHFPSMHWVRNRTAPCRFLRRWANLKAEPQIDPAARF